MPIGMGGVMKKPEVVFRLAVLFIMLACVMLTGCESNDENMSTPNETVTLAPPIAQNEAQSAVQSDEDGSFIDMGGTRFTIPTENTGITSANIRLYVADTERERQWVYAYRLLDFSQIDQYHEFILYANGARFIFTTETTVSDFRFLSIMMNQYFWNENAEEGERAYIVQNTLYFLDELTPEVPFVVQGIIFGGTFAIHGFSFLDETGTRRYFSIEDNILIDISEF